MPKNKYNKPIRKILFALLLIVGICLLFVLIRAPYLPHAIKSSYFRGQNGPGIYDLEVSAYARIKTSDSVELERSKHLFQMADFPEFAKYNKDLGTIAFLISSNDQIILEHYSSEHNKQKISNSFSMAKTVVSLLVGLAVDEGKIEGLDDKLTKYIPEAKGKYAEHVTIRHLLQMAAGTDWKESSKSAFSDNAAAYYTRDLSKKIFKTKFIDPPGKYYDYQSGNTQFLAIILERVYGKGVAELTQDKIWMPMQMSNGAYWSMDQEDGIEKAYCCLYATAEDFLKLGELILHRGKYRERQIIPEWYLDEMVQSKAQRLKTSRHINELYGLHIWTYERLDDPLIFFRGILGQYIIISPKYHWVAVRLGHERLPSYTAAEVDKDHLNMEGQTKDFVQYVKFVDEIIQLSYK